MFTYNNGRIVIHRITKNNENKIISEKEIRKNNQYNEQLIGLPQNDTGNAKRFLLFCRDYAKFDISRNAWLLWDGKVWSSQNAYAELMKLAQAVMDKYYYVVKECTALDGSVKKSMLYHAKSSNNKGSLENMLALAAFMNYVKEMKSEPYLLNVQNGIIDLRKKKLLKHHPRYGCTNICICDYDPDVKSTRFKSFVKEITSYDKSLYEYLKVLAGYFATGLRREEQFYIFWGKTGSNGKSKYLETLEYTLGSYACLFPTNALTKNTADASRPTPELVPLVNIRYAHTSELPNNHEINDASIKQYTGNSHIMVRRMRQEYIKAEVFFKIAIDTNYEPRFKKFDEAIKRRLVIIPFSKKFIGDEKDLNLEEKLQNDSKYVLRFIAEGAYEYFKHGLHEPEIIKKELEEYYLRADSVQGFLDNATLYEEGSLTQSSTLHRAYTEYCQTNHYEPVDAKDFSQSLTQKGFEKKHRNTGTFFKNIKVI